VARVLDAAVAALARKQHGYVTREQLLELGLGVGAIKFRIGSGQLIAVYSGVYAVGHLPSLPIDRAAAAVLACGPTAALSHGSAVSLWGWDRHWRLPFEVTSRVDRRRRGIRVHRSTALSRRDVTPHYGISVTSPARTVLDVAPRYSGRKITRLVNDARLSRLLRVADLSEVLDRNPRHPGTRRLRIFVKFPNGPTRSEFEDAFKAFCERYGLPTPLFNVIVNGREADAYFPHERLIVELDGWDFHQTKAAFEDDRERDVENLVVGLETVRITWERLIEEPDREARRLHAILARRRREAA
jgi:hypothetical protein